jgi:hypothetical protein
MPPFHTNRVRPGIEPLSNWTAVRGLTKWGAVYTSPILHRNCRTIPTLILCHHGNFLSQRSLHFSRSDPSIEDMIQIISWRLYVHFLKSPHNWTISTVFCCAFDVGVQFVLEALTGEGVCIFFYTFGNVEASCRVSWCVFAISVQNNIDLQGCIGPFICSATLRSTNGRNINETGKQTQIRSIIRKKDFSVHSM